MNTIIATKKPGSKKIVWNSPAGYEQAVLACKKKKKQCRLFLKENQWLKAGINSNSYIRIVCEECNINDISVRLGTFIYNKSYRCNCIEKRKKYEPWRGECGFIRFQNLCNLKRVKPMLDKQEIDLAIWEEKQFKSKSKVSLKCRKCPITVTLTIDGLSRLGREILCLCNKFYPCHLIRVLHRRRCNYC